VYSRSNLEPAKDEELARVRPLSRARRLVRDEEPHGSGIWARPFDIIGEFIFYLICDSPFLYPPATSMWARRDPPWLPLLCHRFLIYLALRHVRDESRIDDDKAQALPLHSGSAIFAVLEEQVRPSKDGERAEKAVKGLIKALCQFEEEGILPSSLYGTYP
jgi:hypothetical protein